MYVAYGTKLVCGCIFNKFVEVNGEK